MSMKKTLDALEQTCKDVGVRLVYDELKGEGGLCRLRDSWYLILNRRLSTESRIRIIREALTRVGAAPPLRPPQAQPPPAMPEPTPAVEVEQTHEPEPVSARV